MKFNLIQALVGAFIIYWAQTHSPKAGIGQITKNFFQGSYTMSEPWYYVSLVLGIVILLHAILKLTKVIK